MNSTTRTRSVLTLLSTSTHVDEFDDGTVMATYGNTDTEREENPARYRTVIVDQELRGELGDPELITITIEPGDRLNIEDEDIPEPTYGNATFEVYQREDNKFDWRLKHENGNVVATSGGQGYETAGSAFEIGRRVISSGYNISLEPTGPLHFTKPSDT